MASELKQRSTGKVVELDSADSQMATFTPPNFTIKELLNAIPKECFERSALKSSAYLLKDFIMAAALVFAITKASGTYFGEHGSLLSGTAGQAAKVASWMTYWWFQGLVCTGIWVIAHECGHQAYSPSKTINNTVGWFCHSALLVPYHSWRISHARHHAATGHMTRDEVFVPKTASQIGHKFPVPEKKESLLEKADEILEDAPLYVLANVLAQQLFGWPLYLIRNASGQAHYPRFTNHFDPNSIIFDKRHYYQVIMSNVGLALTVSGLIYAAQKTSAATVMAYYGVPYLFVNHWLVCIVYLQHTDTMLPHYRASEWNFVRGALCTQDRNVYDYFTHDIASTHVLHHIVSSVPFYHGRKATAALKEVLGEHYHYSPENWLVSLFKQFKQCRYVDDEDDVVFYRNSRGKAQRKVVYDSDSGVEVN